MVVGMELKKLRVEELLIYFYTGRKVNVFL